MPSGSSRVASKNCFRPGRSPARARKDTKEAPRLRRSPRAAAPSLPATGMRSRGPTAPPSQAEALAARGRAVLARDGHEVARPHRAPIPGRGEALERLGRIGAETGELLHHRTHQLLDMVARELGIRFGGQRHATLPALTALER